MSKKRRRQKPGPPRGRPGAPDDFAKLPFGVMAQSGRFVHMQRTLSEEEHAEFRDAFTNSADEMLARQEQRRSRILEILTEVDPLDLLGRASLTYLHIDPDTFKEWESDRSPAHVEYLALQALSVEAGRKGPVDPARAMHLMMEAVQLSREMFSDASMLFVIDAVAAQRANPNDPTIEYVLETRLESLAVRGASYHEHLDRVLHGCFDPFDDDCRRLLGFTLADALALTKAWPLVIDERVAPLWRKASDARAELIAAVKRDRRRGRSEVFPDWMLRLPPTEAKQRVGLIAAASLFADSKGLCAVTAEDLAAAAAADPAAASSFLQAFSCPPGEFNARNHAYPGGGHPLTERPLLNDGDTYLLAAPTALRAAIRPRMEDLLRENKKVWDRYVDERGRYVEREAAALLASALPGSRSWTGIKWKSTADESDLDGLVVADDVSLRLQCKAGRLSAPARRGAPERMRRDIGELIEGGARQHQALRQALDAEGAAGIGFSREQQEGLDRLYQFNVIVCLDDVTVWATEAHQLRSLGVLPKGEPVPWVLSLTDLMAVVDLLDGAQLAHYLMRRQRLERDGRVQAHDELDWVGHYISEGLYFDDYFDGEKPPHVFRLLSYTEPIDSWYFTRAGMRTVPAPKPEQPMPKRYAALLDRLAKERPRHWITASVALLDHDDASRKVWDDFVEHAVAAIRDRGWSNASVLSSGSLGLTIYVDRRVGRQRLRGRVAEYASTKAEELDQPNWVAIGEGAAGGFFVELVERDPTRRLTDVFQAPRTSASTATALDGE
jgi:hypothetical protein